SVPPDYPGPVTATRGLARLGLRGDAFGATLATNRPAELLRLEVVGLLDGARSRLHVMEPQAPRRRHPDSPSSELVPVDHRPPDVVLPVGPHGERRGVQQIGRAHV